MFVNLGGYLDVSKKKKTTYRRRASAPSILKTRILCLTTIHIYQSNNFLLRKKKYMCSTKEQKLTLNPLLKRHFYLLPLNKQQFHLEENESFFWRERGKREQDMACPFTAAKKVVVEDLPTAVVAVGLEGFAKHMVSFSPS